MSCIQPETIHFDGWPFWKSLLERLPSPDTGKAYIVGGWVRDIFMYGQSTGQVEMDWALDGDAVHWARTVSSETGALLRKESGLGTASLDIEHQGISVRLDFATCRKDRYPIPGGLPLTSAAEIEEDLGRRDFSVNAMAIEVAFPFRGFGRILDLWDGRKDLRRKKLRILYEESFVDDPTRIFRLIRFACRLGFTTDTRTRKALSRSLDEKCLRSVSRSRVWDEVQKILSEPEPMEILCGWLTEGLLSSVAKSLVDTGPRRVRLQRWNQIFYRLPRSSNEPKFIRETEFLLALFFGLPKGEFIAISDSLGVPGRVRKKLYNVLFEKGYRGNVFSFWEKTGGDIGKMQSECDRMGYESACLLALRAPSELVAFWKNYFSADVYLAPLVTGKDLVHAGVPASPERERILEEIRLLQRLGRVTNKSEAMAWVRENLPRR
jgi:tRNA nucleotidyltransferase (CCA-adding enzyme)